MAAAVAVRVSNFHGQKDTASVHHSASAGFHIILLMALLVSVPLFLLRNEIGGWFTDSHEVTLMVASLILPFILYQFGDGMQCNYSNALRGIADVKPVMYIAFIAYFVISLPAGYLFGFVLDGGLTGIWLSNGFTRAFQEAVDENPNIVMSDLYYKLARQTVGSHATVYNVTHYGNMHTNMVGEFLGM